MNTDEQQAPEVIGAKSGRTRKEQIEALIPALRRMVPNIMQVGSLYNQQYPADKTAPEVLDAVTVAVPYRQFMVMAGVCTSLIAEVIEKEKKATEAGITAASGAA